MAAQDHLHHEHIAFRGARGARVVADRWSPTTPEHGVVLLMHGGGQTRHSWARTVRKLATDGWVAITVDARGHGDSEWSADGEYTLDGFVADLYSVVDTLDRPPVVIGASLGGRTALVAEGERPGTTAGLVLVDIAPRVDAAGQARVRAFMASAPNGFSSLAEVAEAVNAYSPRRRTSRNLEGLKKNVRQHADGRWYWHWDPRFLESSTDERNFAVGRLRRAASNVTVPTMLVRGDHSDMVTAEAANELLELVPSARLVEVAAGHMITGDDNDVFTSHLRGFLTERVQHADGV
ncbi:alpha/beta fold hydrolase [Streptomyces krungchingensis]|uniref:alpha/beta fold hydrolase n=1 Tax=Streptomyces sp. Tue6028 TaxID=2036037 RepID=UPI003EBE8B54